MTPSNVYELLKKYLGDRAVPFREINHAPGASAEEYHRVVGCRYEQQLKCLLLKVYAEGDFFVIHAIPAQKRADLEQVKTLLNARKVRLSTKEELKEITGCNFGELHPFAKMYKLQLLLDEDFLVEQEVFLNAGRVDTSFVVKPQDLQKVETPTLV